MIAPMKKQLTKFLADSGERRVTIEGIEVAYEYEPADRDTGLPEVYLLAAVNIGGRWFSYDAFAEDFWLALEDAIPAAVEAQAAEDMLP